MLPDVLFSPKMFVCTVCTHWLPRTKVACPVGVLPLICDSCVRSYKRFLPQKEGLEAFSSGCLNADAGGISNDVDAQLWVQPLLFRGGTQAPLKLAAARPKDSNYRFCCIIF
jgi:hypothetical protein